MKRKAHVPSCKKVIISRGEHNRVPGRISYTRTQTRTHWVLKIWNWNWSNRVLNFWTQTRWVPGPELGTQL